MAMLRLLRHDDADFEAAFGALEERRSEIRHEVEEATAEIIEQVRARGDAAALEYAARFDGLELTLDELKIDRDAIRAGAQAVDAEDRAALELAARRIRDFHERSRPSSWMERGENERLGQLVRPLKRIGIYVPAAQAPLASTVLMLAVPASVAGVSELVMSVSGREVHPALLAAAELAGVNSIVRLGGAQAVAALAFGTETVPRVEKIVGPGQAYTQAAKRMLFGQVGIDAEAGPSEVLIVAEADAPPEYLAADLLAQAEHVASSVVLVTTSEALALATIQEVERQFLSLPHSAAMRESLEQRSAAIVVREEVQAQELANRYAAEHLQLYVSNPDAWLDRIENAGAIFLGPYSPVTLGDYVAGPSHVLPTGGTARFFSPVGVEDFVKRMSVVEIDRQGIQKIGPAAIRLAELEGLQAHAEAVRRRLMDNPGS